MGLADLIAREREWIIERWLEQAYEQEAPRALDRDEVMDDLREMLEELEAKLRIDVTAGGTSAPPTLELAKAHGQQRFRIGYDIAAVVREHSLLREVIFDAVARAGYAPLELERSSLSGFLYSALADSASHYAIARDREVREQAERYISFLAHELRNPLGTARLALSLLQESGAITTGRATDSLQRALDQMQELIDRGLADFSSRGTPRPACQELELDGFLHQVVHEVEPEASTKKISTEVALEEPLKVEADSTLLRSAISNLVRNAIKFSRPAGLVRVEAKRGNGRVIISVQDSCGGLPPGSVERLFNPFVQAGHDRSGFGLGLAIAKQAAEAHGGAIRVHDLPGRGCIFVLDLPLRCL